MYVNFSSLGNVLQYFFRNSPYISVSTRITILYASYIAVSSIRSFALVELELITGVRRALQRGGKLGEERTVRI